MKPVYVPLDGFVVVSSDYKIPSPQKVAWDNTPQEIKDSVINVLKNEVPHWPRDEKGRFKK